MKVLHVIPSIAPCRGGPSEAVLAMTRALHAQGVEADIVTTNDNGSSLLPVETGSMLNHEGNPVCFLPRWSPGVAALREFQYAADFTPWLKAALPNYDGLHVHAVFSYLSTRAMMIARATGVPYMVRPLGQLDAWSLEQKALKKRLYYALIEKHNLRGAAVIHCTSAMESLHVHALLPQSRTEVIPHGVEPLPEVLDAPSRLRQQMALPMDEPLILFLSRWHPKKNIPLLLAALSGMTSQRWTLVLAGSGDADYTAKVRLMIRQHGLGNRVRCPGHVQGEDKALLLQGTDVFVLPSSSENFGIAVAEALICGLPAVVTSGVDLAPAVTALHGGRVCDATADSLRSALQQVLHDPGNRPALGAAARRRFAWDAPAAKISALYAELFSRHLP